MDEPTESESGLVVAEAPAGPGDDLQGGRSGRLQRWRELIAGQAASGLSIRAFCRQQQLSCDHFYYYRRCLRHAAAPRPAPAAAPAPAPFVALQLQGGGGVELLLRSGHLLRWPEGVVVEDLARLILALERGGGAA